MKAMSGSLINICQWAGNTEHTKGYFVTDIIDLKYLGSSEFVLIKLGSGYRERVLLGA